ncbi:MAG: hypothetical protein QF830_01905 [Rhodospirillales bacterium]|nr:hypothetical protein [Rhodospirillales bacterium]MDP6882867.1 hypothetical protein [Rhodospirillales bacterium]
METLIALVEAALLTFAVFGIWHLISRKFGWTDKDRDSSDR